LGILDAIQTGLSELLSHKLRSMLTMLGVIFGVGAVIAMVSIGEGAKQWALEQIQQMGIDIVHVKRAVIAGELAEKAQERSPFGLKLSDADSIKDVCSFAKRVIPLREVFADIRSGGSPVSLKVVGTVPGYDIVTHAKVASGRFLTEKDVDKRESVCVLGAAARRELFGFENPVGKTMRMGNSIFRVVGVMEAKEIGEAKALSALRDLNSDVYIPITISITDFQMYSQQALPVNIVNVMSMIARLRSRQIAGNSQISEIIVQVANDVATVPTASIIRSVLNRRHQNIRDYEIIIPAELLRQKQQTQDMFNLIMLAIASISLLVGGIGIMNIMLATVTQRTREIGIRRCIGATRWDIIRQFMLEALVITCLGGVIGIIAGIGAAQAISAYADWRTVVSMQAVIVSFGVSVVVGVVFGMYPAIRAAMVDPIEALRYS
jgi:ABC-type antimicrobial peptide transport system permease subunit